MGKTRSVGHGNPVGCCRGNGTELLQPGQTTINYRSGSGWEIVCPRGCVKEKTATDDSKEKKTKKKKGLQNLPRGGDAYL